MYTVLHIEQSDFFRKVVKSILNKKGYEYISTDSFKDAYQILREYDINLIITSLFARDGTIENFIININQSKKFEIPIFVVTSSHINENKRKLLNLGISEYILKENLEEEITKHIDAVFQEDVYMKDLQEAKIAVVDDSQFERTIEKNLLFKHKIVNIDHYTSGKDLLNSGKNYDVYLVDIILKDEFGKNLIRKVRRYNINAIIIAVTSLDNSKTLASILNSGADDFITKPIDENLFIAKLKCNIRTYSLHKRIKSFVKEIHLHQ